MAAVEVAEICPKLPINGGSQAEILSEVRDVYNHGSTLNSVAGDVHYHQHTYGPTQHAMSVELTPASTQQDPRPELPSQLYSRILMREGRGYPLMDATLPNELPSQYQSHGVMIGDVGIVAEDGYFDVLFNICEPADGDINEGMVPEGFIHLERPPNNRHNYRRGRSFEPGGCAVSDLVQVTFPTTTSGEPSSITSEFQFQVSEKEGAILALPYGAHKEDIVDRKKFLEYAANHGVSWYEFVNGTLGRNVANGSIYLITGYDKACSWGTASFFSSPTRSRSLITFTEQGWHNHHGRAYARRGPTRQSSTSDQENQCIFLRGYKVTLGSTILARLFGVSLVDTSPMDKITPEPGQQSLLKLFSIGSSLATLLLGSLSNARNQGAAKDRPVLTSISSSLSPEIHPSNLINLYLLSKSPGSDLAITHDSVWCSYLKARADSQRSGQTPYSLFDYIDAECVLNQEARAIFLSEQNEPESRETDSSSIIAPGASAGIRKPGLRPQSHMEAPEGDVASPLEDERHHVNDVLNDSFIQLSSPEKPDASAHPPSPRAAPDMTSDVSFDGLLEAFHRGEPVSPSDMSSAPPPYMGGSDVPQTEAYNHPSLGGGDRQVTRHDEPHATLKDSTVQEFELDWASLSRGMTSLDPKDIGDIVHGPSDPNLRSHSRRLVRHSRGAPSSSAALVPNTSEGFLGSLSKTWDMEAEPGTWIFKKEKLDSGHVDLPVSSRSEGSHMKDATTREFHEQWRSNFSGLFRVDLTETKSQQITIIPVPDSSTCTRHIPKGPSTTIRKHSKGTAYSITRYHTRTAERNHRSGTDLNSSVLDARGSESLASTSIDTILFGPKAVQENFTTTEITHPLAEHGLLEVEHPKRAIAKVDLHGDLKQRRSMETLREDLVVSIKDTKHPHENDILKARLVMCDADKRRAFEETLAGTTLIEPDMASLKAKALSDVSRHTYPPNFTMKEFDSDKIGEPYFFDHDSQMDFPKSVLRLGLHINDHESDLSTLLRTPSPRTPYAEIYSTIDPLADHFSRPMEPVKTRRKSLFGALSSPPSQPHLRPYPTLNPLDTIYEPPWISLAQKMPKIKHETTRRVMRSPFKSLRATKSSPEDLRKHTRPANDRLQDIPPDHLYMILPLWPGETDMQSQVDYPTKKLVLPASDRQYVLVIYKPIAVSTNVEEVDSLSKQRFPKFLSSKNSKSAMNQKDEGGVSTAFDITCRVVNYANLQGSGVRAPAEGLTITGPLQTAILSMGQIDDDNVNTTWVLGTCRSRDTGIEFYPECLRHLKLATEEGPPDDEVRLTPVGRAIMEMVCAGGIALTSFG